MVVGETKHQLIKGAVRFSNARRDYIVRTEGPWAAVAEMGSALPYILTPWRF